MKHQAFWRDQEGVVRVIADPVGQKFTYLYTGEQFAVWFLRSDNTNHRCKRVDASLPFYSSQAGEAKIMRPGGGFLARHRVASIPMRLDTNRQNRARARCLGEAERRTDDHKGWG
jgi:hypothetical protein